MNSEKVKEIKENLKEEIILGEAHNKRLIIVELDLIKNALTRINELESENNWLVGKIKEKNSESADCLLKTQQLKDRIAELEEDKEKWQRKAVNYYQMAKSYGVECIIDNDIDEINKEYENDTNIKGND